MSESPLKLAVSRASGLRLLAYFCIDYVEILERRAKYLEVEYLDIGKGTFFLERGCEAVPDRNSLAFSRIGQFQLTGRGKVKRALFDIEYIFSPDRLTGGDFRINVIDNEIDEFRIEGLALHDEIPDSASIDHYVQAVEGNDESLDDDNLPRIVFPGTETKLELQCWPGTDVSIVIPVFNTYRHTRNCLLAIQEYTLGNYEVILVDNGSTECEVRSLASVENLNYIRLETNTGFAHASNTGAESANGAMLLFLNNDTIVQPGWLESMVSTLRSYPKIGIVGSKLLYPDSGRVQHAGIEIDHKYLPVHRFRDYRPDHSDVNKSIYCEAVTGACLLTPRDLFLSLGGFDEEFTNGFEDVDYCFRVRERGLKVAYCHTSVVYHYESMTEGRDDAGRNQKNLQIFSRRWINRLIQLVPGRPPLDRSILPVAFKAGDAKLQSATGSLQEDHVLCEPGKNQPGYCIYGPYVKVEGEFPASAIFDLEISDCVEDSSSLIAIEVRDNVSGEIFVRKLVSQASLDRLEPYLVLDFDAAYQQTLEFRVFWFGGCKLKVNSIELAAR